MGVIAIAISLISLGFTAWVYFRYDRFIKQYQLRKFEEEKTSRQSALIKVEKLMEPNSRGYNDVYLLITNMGVSKATNLKVWTDPNVLISKYEVPYFNPGQEEKRLVVLSMGGSDRFEAHYSWEDGLGKHEDSVIISFG